MKYYFHTQLGETRFISSDGGLLCKDVPIARTGTQLYGAEELPELKANGAGEIRVERPEEEVFRPETIASFEGMSITLLHPDGEFVNPDNWSELAKGHVQNVRRGNGGDSDLLIADLMVKDQAAISAIDDGLREISCGYDAKYEQIEPGRGVQRNIVGNHVALVDKARGGFRLKIGDRKMAKKSWLDRVRQAFKTRDEDLLEEALDEAPGEEAGGAANRLEIVLKNGGEAAEGAPENKPKEATLDDNTDVNARLDRLEALITRLVEGKTADDLLQQAPENFNDDEPEGELPGQMTGDAAYSPARGQDIMARAEILSPGIKLPTTDSMKTKGTLAKFKRRALDSAWQTERGKAAIEPFLAGKKAEFKTLSASTIDAAFYGASEIIKARNNQSVGALAQKTMDFGRAVTPADINKANAAYWAERAGK